MTKALMVFIEGQDRSGKTSTIIPIFSKTGKIHNIIDRGPLSNLVYSILFKRKNVDLISYEYFLMNERILTFYLDTSIEQLKQRTILSNDYNVSLDDIEVHKKVWKETTDKFKNNKNFFVIDNSELTIKETIDIISKKIIEYGEKLND